MVEFLSELAEGVGVVALMGAGSVAVFWGVAGFPVKPGGAF